jgi:hypothetical protein
MEGRREREEKRVRGTERKRRGGRGKIKIKAHFQSSRNHGFKPLN